MRPKPLQRSFGGHGWDKVFELRSGDFQISLASAFPGEMLVMRVQ